MSSIKLKHASGNSMSIGAPATNPASDLELKLPATIGTSHQLLRNSGTAGTLEFTHNHFFEVKRSTNQTGYNGNSLTSIIEFDSENYDTGSNFNTSTYLFTVPETGLYYFIGSGYTNESNVTQSWLVVNGSRHAYTDWVLATASSIISSSHLEYLTAADTVGYHVHTGTDTSCTINQSVNHTYFKGYKVH
tara:strand:+ start:1585 stop:2154 length:570 start_codon:yes stop_codon:yes gene_type:complete